MAAGALAGRPGDLRRSARDRTGAGPGSAPWIRVQRLIGTLTLVLALALGLTLTGMPARAVAMVDPRIDRAYGYLIGDTVTAEASVPIPPGLTLDPQSLPHPGRVNGWLHLLEVDARRIDDRLRLQRRFLVTASADTVKLIWLPRVALRFVPADGGAAANGDAEQVASVESVESVDAVALTISPITAGAAFVRNGLGELRPDHPPPLPDLARLDRGLAAALVALLLSAGLAGLGHWRQRRRGDGAPFRAAARELAGLERRGDSDPVDLGRAYRALHHAFDLSAGRTLMSADIDDFLDQRPRLSRRRDAILAFYTRSDARFFAATQPPADPEPAATRAELRTLRRLARQLASEAG